MAKKEYISPRWAEIPFDVALTDVTQACKEEDFPSPPSAISNSVELYTWFSKQFRAKRMRELGLPEDASDADAERTRLKLPLDASEDELAAAQRQSKIAYYGLPPTATDAEIQKAEQDECDDEPAFI